MVEQGDTSKKPLLETTSGPHLAATGTTTRGMMWDVLIGLIPVALAAVWFFRGHALIQIGVAVATALATEAACCALRGRRPTWIDGSVTITALLLVFSLPPRLPWYATVAGTFMAVALGKMVFGGLGHNIFNPDMVGRAFLMVCFPALMTSWAEPLTVDATTQATPLAAAKFAGEQVELEPLVTGQVGGSVGETAAIPIVIGGMWLLIRRAGDWRLTAGMLTSGAVVALIQQFAAGGENTLGPFGHLCAGGFLMGAFFIITDPVTSPITVRGRWAFGILVGTLTMIIRLFAGYPEGVMFAVLVGNAFVPLLNRWTMPVPVGGKTLQTV